MRPHDLFRLSVKGLSERKLRTALTVLCVVIGVAAIVGLVSLVSGVSASISHELESIGPTTFYMVASPSHLLTAADVAVIESLPNVTSVVPIVSFSANITESGTQTTVTVYGIANYSLAGVLGKLDLYEGQQYNGTALPYAVVGHDVAFPNTGQLLPSVNINQPIYLTEQGSSGKSITLIPVGILNSYGSAAFISPDSSIFIPIQSAESITDRYSYSALLVKASNTGTVNAVSALLNAVYGNNARIISVQQLASTVSSIIGSLGLLLGAIAGISLLVAAISILSIMMVSVTERTHEIGILKAIGFKRRDVLALFLSEALIIGLLGGLIGSAIGVGISYALPGIFSGAPSSTAPQGSTAQKVFIGGGASTSAASSSFTFTSVIDPTVIAIAILVAIAVSLLSSLYPAWKASTIDPISALRSE